MFSWCLRKASGSYLSFKQAVSGICFVREDVVWESWRIFIYWAEQQKKFTNFIRKYALNHFNLLHSQHPWICTLVIAVFCTSINSGFPLNSRIQRNHPFPNVAVSLSQQVGFRLFYTPSYCWTNLSPFL